MPAPVAPTVPLHRIRFFDHTPSPITALAFAPLPLPAARDPSVAPAASTKGKARSDETELGALVVARDNGEVEIWEYVPGEQGGTGNWVLEKTLPPTLTHPTISVMALVIRDPEGFASKPYAVPRISDLRLFTAGSESIDLTERCLETGRVLQTYPIPSPPLWSMSVSPTHQLLCLTTNSPHLHFLSIPTPFGTGVAPLEGPPTHLLRSDGLPSRTRTVSVAWGVPKLAQDESGSWAWRDSYVITGNSDSSFRRWELPPPASAGTAVGRVTIKSRAVVEKVAKGKKGGHKGTIVWGVGVLPDGTIVTSDSLGSVTFWDPATMSQRQSFRAHKADGMCMAIGPGGRTVFTSGPDQRVCQFTALPQANGSTQWALTATKRLHTHDVRALSIFPSYVPLPSNSPLAPPPLNPGLAPILASGGWDMAPVLTPAAAPELLAEKLRNPLGKDKKAARVVFEEAYSRKLPMFGGERGQGRIAVSRGGRLVVGRKDRSVGIWRVKEAEDGWTKVLDMDLKLRTNLISSAVSQDGQWLAVSDLYETKLFRLRSIGGSANLYPVRIRDFVSDLTAAEELGHLSLSQVGCGASSLLFTPDSGRLVMALAASANVVIVELPADDDDEISVVRCFAPQHHLVGGRSIAPAKGKRRRRGKKAAAAPDSDVEMDSSASADEADGQATPSGPTPWVTTLAASDDGQYLATSDLGGKVTIFNLDTLQLHALLPTLPSAPVALLFAPTHPLLVLVNPTNSLQFYHLDGRRLIAPTPQIATLNSTLRGLHACVEGAAFEPSRQSPRSAKIVLFAHDWLATARLDLDLIARGHGGRRSSSASLASLDSPEPATLSSKSLRRKRAREAREQLVEAASVSPSLASSDVAPGSPTASLARTVLQPSSANDPDFLKIVTDRFRSVVAVDWLGEGELMLVERPYADFVGELPPAFWTGSYGRA